jgi:uncharacterized membrane protein YciS (DUF1049 family)
MLLPAVAVLNAVIHGSQLKAFLERISVFATYQDIVEFEKVVARQMYAALVQIALLVGPGVIFVIGLIRGVLLIEDIFFVVLPSFVIIALGAALKKVENKVRSIPVSDPLLEERRDHIVMVWNTKPFPDW